MKTAELTDSIHTIAALPPDFENVNEKMQTYKETAQNTNTGFQEWANTMLGTTAGDTTNKYGQRSVPVKEGAYHITRQRGRYGTDVTSLSFVPEKPAASGPEEPAITFSVDSTKNSDDLILLLQASKGNDLLEQVEFGTQLNRGEPAVLDGCQQFIQTAQSEIEAAQVPATA